MVDAQSKGLASNLLVGTMGWSYAFWKKIFYPADLASNDFLAFYAKNFDTVEVDSTFYRIPRSQTVTEWEQQTPQDFFFSLKFPQKITHVKMLKDCQEETRVFLERANLLEKKLGALLLQLPPIFQQKNIGLLADYLSSLPTGYRYTVEVRNKSLLNDELYTLLKKHNVALAWVDAARMPFVSENTADFLYLRLEGDRKAMTGTLGKTEINRAVDIQTWAKRLQAFLQKGLLVFVYFSKYYSGYPINDAEEFLKQVSVFESQS